MIASPNPARRVKLIGIASSLFLLLAMLLFPSLASAASTTKVTLTSAAGEYIGSGTSHVATPSTIVLGGTRTTLTLSFQTSTEKWLVHLAAPYGQELRTGTFANAERAGRATGYAPGLHAAVVLASGGGQRNCLLGIWGTFTINQIEFDANGVPTMLDARFTQRCGSSTAPALNGTIQVASTPMKFSYTNTLGSFGFALSNSYSPIDSRFRIQSGPNSININVSGRRDDLSITLGGAVGRVLKPGVYTRSFNNPTGSATLYMYDKWTGAGCQTTAQGSFTVYSLTRNVLGNIDSIYAKYSIWCGSSTNPLTGIVHYRA